MRKRDPNAIIDQFQAELASTLADWRVLTGSTLGKVARRATMDASARAAVAFERFRSDWHIAAITRDASVFSPTQLNRAKEALKETKRDSLAPFIQVTIPTHPTLDQVGALLDATGSNVSLPNIGAWKKKAKVQLADPWVGKVTGISWRHEVAADAVIAIRNAASHQSDRSLSDMNAALAKLTDPAAHRGLLRPANRVTLTGIPAYLHGSIPGRPPRVETYVDLLERLSGTLRV